MATVGAHVFLSPAWINAVRQISDGHRNLVQESGMAVRANVTITDAPFDEPTVLGHLDTNSGTLLLDEGHLTDTDFAIEMPYPLAYEAFVERDPAALVPVLLGGRLKLSGDSSKILLLADFFLPSEDSLDTASALASAARKIIKQIDAITQRS